MAKSFRIGGLSTVYHTKKTREAFKGIQGRSQSRFVAEKIVNFAQKCGFTKDDDFSYIDQDRLNYIQTMQKKARYVDYTYLLAFEYLRYKVLEDVPKSVIIRKAILSQW